jgi:hypothetical protein
VLLVVRGLVCGNITIRNKEAAMQLNDACDDEKTRFMKKKWREKQGWFW